MIKRLLRKIKRKIKIITGRISPIRREIKCNFAWYGSDYGGFYVNPDALNTESIVYSFGVGEDISFEKVIIENHNCHVYSFDPTPKSIKWMKNQQLPHNLNFFEYGINNKTGSVNFNLPKNNDYISGSIIKHRNVDENNIVSVPMKCLNDIIAELGHNHIDVLKMDIEGSEFEVIDSILLSTIKIDQILIELHERFFADGKSKVIKLLKTLKDNGYAVFAVSDSFAEVSFIRIRK